MKSKLKEEKMTDYLNELLEFISEHDVLPQILVADALVPLNPERLPPYLSGVVCGADANYGFGESFQTVGFNLVEVYEYSDSARTAS